MGVKGSTPLGRSLLPASFAALVSPGICIPRVRSILGSENEDENGDEE